MKKLLAVMLSVALLLSGLVYASADTAYSVQAAQLVLGESLGVTLYTNIPYSEAGKATFDLNGRTFTAKPMKEGDRAAYKFTTVSPDEAEMPIVFKAGSVSYTFRYVDIIDLMLRTDGYDDSIYELLSSLVYYVKASIAYNGGTSSYTPHGHFVDSAKNAPAVTDKSVTPSVSESVYMVSVGYYFNNSNKVYLVFRTDDAANTKVSFNGTTFGLSSFEAEGGNQYRVYSDSVSAKELSAGVTVKLKYGSREQTLRYSPEAYAYSVMNGDYTQKEKDLAWSLWKYADSTTDYVRGEVPYLEIRFDTDRYNASKLANEEIFPGYGEFNENAGPEGWGFYAYMVYPDSDAVYIPESDLTWGPVYAPDTVGPFDVTWTYTDADNNTYTATVPFSVYEPGQILNTYALSRQAGLRGSVNGVSLNKIIFCDMEVPDSSECATLANVGERLSNVYAFRYLGQEDVLYVTSGIPGKKVVHPGYGEAVNTGYIKEIDCRGLDTSRLTQLSSAYPFWGNGAIFQNGVQKINYSGCDFSGLTSLSLSFNNMNALKELDLSYCKFPNVTSLSHMCYYSRNLEVINLTGATFGTGITNMEYAFGTTKVKTVDMSGFAGVAPTTIQGMFMECSELEEVDFSAMDFTNVTDAAYLFQNCRKLHTVGMPASGMPNLTETVRQMFDDCRELQNIDLSGLDLSNVSIVFRFLYNCRKLQTTLNLDATLFNTSMGYTFDDMAIDDTANVIVNCSAESYEKLQNMIRVTNVQYTQHVTYNIQ